MSKKTGLLLGSILTLLFLLPKRGSSDAPIYPRTIDQSSISIHESPLDVDIILVDPNGNRTGSMNTPPYTIEKIPRSGCWRVALDDNDTGIADSAGNSTITVNQPSKGIYKLLISGPKTTTFDLQIDFFDSNGKRQLPVYHPAPLSIQPGIERVFELNFNPAPGAQSTVTEKV